MSWSEGFNVGWRAVSDARKQKQDAEDRARRIAQEDKDRAEREALQADLKRVYEQAPQPVQSDTPSAEQVGNYDRYNASLAKDDARTFGVTAQPGEYRYGTPKLAETVTRYGVDGREYDTPDAAQSGELSRTLGKHGDYRGAMAVRQAQQASEQAAQGIRIAGNQEDRAAGKYEQEQKQKQSAEEFGAKVFDMSKGGTMPKLEDVYKAASESGVTDPNMVNAVLMNRMKMNKEQIDSSNAQRIQDLRAAIPNGTDAIMKLFGDPDPNDNLAPTAVKVKGGMKVMYGDKELIGGKVFKDSNELGDYLLAAVDQSPVAFAYANQKRELDLAKTRSEIGENNAQAGNANASAALSRAKTASELAGGGVGKASDKVPELLNKYSGWFKSALQIGDTMMSNIDEKEAKKRQAIYERAMGIAQRELAKGNTPSYESIMNESRAGGIPEQKRDIGNYVPPWKR